MTTPGATALVDGYDPARGLAHRATWFEYEGARSEALVFRLCSPGRLREAAIGTGWRVEEVEYEDEHSAYYRMLLEKR